MTRNPLRQGGDLGISPEPVSFVIFGATGDLAQRKLVPALYSLAQESHLPAAFRIVGFARRDWSDQDLREMMREGVAKFSRYPLNSDAPWASFAQNLSYVQGDFDNPDGYKRLDQALRKLAEDQNRPDNRLYYLSAPPSAYEQIVANLGAAGMAQDAENGWRRIIIEKPFGTDLPSAQALNHQVHQVFQERQVYRIDHYLGKETVQNILVLRFANAIFEPIWNRRYVDHVQISVAEAVGVEGRAAFYDQSGVVRDIIQNHLLQLVMLVGMEPPVAFEAGAIRDEKVKVLRALRPLSPDDVRAATVRAQYSAGVLEGEKVPGYLEEPNIPPGSTTPTYAAMRWYIDSWRWQGVPFYIRSGKRMTTRATEIAIHFKQPPHLLFGQHNGDTPNVLALRIQPDEGIALRFEAKLPGQGLVRRPVTMDFDYGASFGIEAPPEAYERLLLDAVLGDATLFARSDEIEYAWAFIDPVLEAWNEPGLAPMQTYEAGTWGPEQADLLLEQDGRRWRRL